ncbi:hypothetical protein [Parasitella parasitica]|uniref:HCP-like protein n=1 Tax=Parasitella parasitica TaxID=35722 RepID=A0A0B7NGP1_9FUNG|nr:hypothetical protein [Parasitella parasitica]
MGNNISSSSKCDAASFKKSRHVQRQTRSSSPSLSVAFLHTSSPSNTATVDQEQQENINIGTDTNQIHAQTKLGKRPLMSNIEPSLATNALLPVISEKQRDNIFTAAATTASSEASRSTTASTPQHLDKLSPHKRLKSQRNSRQSKMRERYSSTISASGFSSSIGDPMHFSMIMGESSITDITNASTFSVNSFLDKVSDGNNYIMAIPDTDFVEANNKTGNWSTELASSTPDILDLLARYPEATYDILTSIFGSARMRSNAELQREAFQAAETWSLRPTDVSAKIIVACCKLCGWGTNKNSAKGFNEIQALATRGVWEAFYYLGQCFHYGVEQASDGYNLSGRPLSAHVVQPVDRDQAISWYRKVVETSSHIASERVRFYVAEAQFRIAAINFASGNINLDNVDENINYLKQSVAAGNRKSEFSLGLLLQTGVIQDSTLSAKDYYTKSANKSYAPSQIQLATILLKDNSPVEGISWLNKAARLGDPRALYHLGECYEFGKGVKPDLATAVHNYQTAADRYSHHMSEFRLGMHYLYGGLGLDKDILKAFIYLERAAKGGYPEAQYLLGMMYRDGKAPLSSTRSMRQTSAEVSRNKKEAFRWIRKAANQRLHSAITQIASCYEDGVGTPVNRSSATEYYEIATSIPGKYLPSAQLTYARFLHKNGNYEKALKMYLYASGLKHSALNTHAPNATIARTAKRMVALLYLDERDTTTPYKPKEAFKLLTELIASVPEADADAHYWIAVCYEEGIPGVVEIDLAKAFEHYVAGANLGSIDSQFQVGHMLCKGIGVKEDRLAAFSWFQKAAEKSNAKALYYIGIYYYNGSGSIEKDHQQARIYFKQSAELGHVEAMVSFAQICQEKLKQDATSLSSTEIDALQADSTRWYTKAAKQNHTTALRELGRLYAAKGDDKSSADCYFKASNLNDALSTLFLGGYYENGQGVTQNKQTALAYYSKAIELGQPTALFAIAELYEKLEEYEKAYSYYQRVSVDSRISKSYRSSKVSRLKMALYSLNYDPNTPLFSEKPSTNANTKIFISSGLLLPKPEAFRTLLNLAQEESLTDAYNWIAECYQDGNGVAQNSTLSVQWRVRASQEANDIHATAKLASMYEHGTDGVEKNLIYSHQLYQMCAEKNNVLSQHKLGMAVVWFTRSARQGYAPSHWALGQIALENGDLHIAIAWWETAMKLNINTRQDPINVDHLLTTTCDSEALVILGKIIQNQTESVLYNATETSSVASAHSSSSHLGSSSVHSSDEAELFSRAQKENHGLALRCFGQAASMGNVEGMYLAAQAWHRDKDYPMALEHYEKAAAQGHLPSRIMCATYQIYGLGGKEINAHAGFNELLDCALHDPDAYIHLGRCCERGLGTFTDVSKALEWYHLSIEQKDDSEAMFRVGQIHAAISQESSAVQGDLEALHWYRRAISKDNHPRANFRIAFYYIHGIQQRDDPLCLLAPDLGVAVQHLRVAACQNDHDAMFELGQLLLNSGFSLELQSEGLRWYQAAAEKGSRDALRELGNLYHTGRGDEEQQENQTLLAFQQDFDKAYECFSRGAHLGDKTSALFLGTYYEHGIGVAPNADMAQQWYTLAVELGRTVAARKHALPLHDPSGWWPAQLCLARVLHQNEETQSEAYRLFATVYHAHRPEQHLAYLEFMLAQYELYGLGGVSVQTAEAVSKLLKLAEQGYLKAFFPVAQCYQNGIGVDKDPLKALEWYVLLVHIPVVAVDQDSMDQDDLDDLSQAYFYLAEFYRQGTVVAMDTDKADMLYQIAAERGSIEAKEHLSLIKDN